MLRVQYVIYGILSLVCFITSFFYTSPISLVLVGFGWVYLSLSSIMGVLDELRQR